ncbi:MAG TPA: pseudomurein-binding repeat-containing protein [Methanobacterium sp.]|nr:pseudomurein-binding repeat-containing protein [Methanobacterium sp.]
MAMSTMGSSFAAANSQQTAENINNSVNIDNNTVEHINSSSTETQKAENNIEVSNKTAQSGFTLTNQSAQNDTTSGAIPVVSTVNNSKVSDSAQNETNQNSVDTGLNQSVQNSSIEPQAAAGDNYTNIHGIWLKAEDIGNITAADMKNANITDIFVKTNFISAPTYQSVLSSIISKFQNSGIRIHAWITCFKDANGNWIDPANATQRTFLLNSITDIVKNYNIDGIFLDYVRYSGVGNNTASSHNGTATITSFVSDVKKVIQANKPKVALSAALMPEGATNANSYGQDYTQLAQYLDFLVPMIYKGNYGQNSSWVGSTTKYIVDHSGGKPVIAGLQTYISDYDTTLLSANELNQDIKAALDNGASGYTLFRYGMISQDFLKPPSFTLSQIKDAAAKIKTFIETNKALPNFVTIGTTQVKMSDFLKLMTTSLIQLNSGKTTSVILKNVNAPQNSTESFNSGNIDKTGYLDIANRINAFIDANNMAPSYATTTLGKISYESLIYMYSKILNYANTNNALPAYVSMNPTMKISPPKVSVPTTTTFTLDQIKQAATSVKSFIETNKALPNYVTIDTEQVQMTDFLRLLLIGTIEVNDGVNAPVSLKTVNASATPSENITNGTIDKAGYIDLANRVKAFIDANGAIPNHATTTLGEIKFESLVYMYSKILNFYNTNNALPTYVSMTSWSEVTKVTSMPVPADLQQYLAATANCQVNDPKIKALAASITSGKTSAYDKAVAIFNWVRDNIGYSFYYNTKYGAVGTLSSKTANCVDTAHLLIALSRAAGLPAKYEHVNAQFSSGNWYGHVVAQIWVNGVWYIADATSSRNTFGVVNNWNRSTATLKGFYASLPF